MSEQWFGPFGRRLDAQGRDLPRNTGVPDGLRIGFTGHEQEDTLGLVDMRGRYYDPSQRRFLTPDPIIAHPLSSQGFSPYAYVSNNPLSRTDPTGFFDGFTDEDRPGALDEGAWSDASGLPDIDGGAGSADGGMSADYDDYDGGDFDPGEAMAGQDEEGGNDGTDAWSESGSGRGSTGESKGPPQDSASYRPAETAVFTHDFTGDRGGDRYFEVGGSRSGLGARRYDSSRSRAGFRARPPREPSPDVESGYWVSHYLFSRRPFRIQVQVTWTGRGHPPESVRVQVARDEALRTREERYRAGGSTLGIVPSRTSFEEHPVHFVGRVATTSYLIEPTGTWNAVRVGTNFEPGFSIVVTAVPAAP